jgi:hypothetical protein
VDRSYWLTFSVISVMTLRGAMSKEGPMLISKYPHFLKCLLLSVTGKLRSHPVGSTVFLDDARRSSNLCQYVVTYPAVNLSVSLLN